jgi:hypothetical protein
MNTKLTWDEVPEEIKERIKKRYLKGPMPKWSKQDFEAQDQERSMGIDPPREWVESLLPKKSNVVKLVQGMEDEHPKRRQSVVADYERCLVELGYTFRRNVLMDRLEFSLGELKNHPLTDAAEASILAKLSNKQFGNVGKARIAMEDMGNKGAYHPVKEFFELLKWDGADHVGKFCSFFTDAHNPVVYSTGEQRTLFHALMRRWIIGAVGKVYDSALNQNPVFVLDGVQRLGKSYMCEYVCPKAEWFFEGPIKPEDKDYWGYLASHLVWEVSEIGSTMRKADLDALKHFITKKEVVWRPAYGRRDIQKPAMASFIGTLNDVGGFLDDPTGHTRFRPVKVMSIDYAYSKEVDKLQLWAQAVALYSQGETYKLSEEESVAVNESQQDYEVENPIVDEILERYDIDPLHTTFISGKEIFEGLSGGPSNQAYHKAMKKLGCVRTRKKINQVKTWVWSGLVQKN